MGFIPCRLTGEVNKYDITVSKKHNKIDKFMHLVVYFNVFISLFHLSLYK